MPELGVSPVWVDVGTLCVISFLSFMGGVVLQRWPDRVREHCEIFDGSLTFLSREAHLALAATCAWVLRAASLAALIAAASLL